MKKSYFEDEKGNYVPRNVDRLQCKREPHVEGGVGASCKVWQGYRAIEVVIVKDVEISSHDLAVNEYVNVDFKDGVVDVTAGPRGMKCRIENPVYSGDKLTLKCMTGDFA